MLRRRAAAPAPLRFHVAPRPPRAPRRGAAPGPALHVPAWPSLGSGTKTLFCIIWGSRRPMLPCSRRLSQNTRGFRFARLALCAPGLQPAAQTLHPYKICFLYHVSLRCASRARSGPGRGLCWSLCFGAAFALRCSLAPSALRASLAWPCLWQGATLGRYFLLRFGLFLVIPVQFSKIA